MKSNHSIAKYTKLHLNARISREKYFEHVLLMLMLTDEANWHDHFSIVPVELRHAFGQYCEETLIPVDFMPSPQPFMAIVEGESSNEDKKRELRPRYQKLYAAIKEYIRESA